MDTSGSLTGTSRLVATTEAQLLQAVRAADAAGRSIRLVGDSVGDAASIRASVGDRASIGDAEASANPESSGQGCQLIEVATSGMDVNDDGCDVDDLVFCGAVLVTLAAGERWSSLVDVAVQRGWVGVEALAAVPGRVGGVVRANVSAFGQQPSDTVASVRTWDRLTDRQRTFALSECGFRPGGSRFVDERLPDGRGRYLLLEVALLLVQGDLTARLHDPDLLGLLGGQDGDRVPLTSVRAAVRGT